MGQRPHNVQNGHCTKEWPDVGCSWHGAWEAVLALCVDGCRCVHTGAHEHFRSRMVGSPSSTLSPFHVPMEIALHHMRGHLQPQDTILYKQITDWLLFLLMDTQVVSSLQRQDPQGDACLPLGEPMTVSCCICLVTPSRLARSKWIWVQDAHRCCQRPSKDVHHAFPSLLSIQWMLLLFLKQW